MTRVRELVCSCIPQRCILGLMCFLGLACGYIQRFCLSMAITEMVLPVRAADSGIGDRQACPLPASPNNQTVDGGKGDFSWDEATQGLILSSFFWGYVVMHLPGGILAERLGGKLVLAAGMFVSSVCTLLTPTVAANFGPAGLIVLRIFLGLGQGPIYPTLNVLLARWIPKTERGRFGAIVFSGAHIGNVTSMALSGVLIYHGGWRSVFYTFGIVGLLWTLLWYAICYDQPSVHPFISKSELDYLNGALCEVKAKEDLPPTPWKSILTSRPVWVLAIVQFGHDWGLFTIAADLPKYMKGIIHLSLTQNGLTTAAPYLALWIFSNVCGWLVDWLVGKKKCVVNTVRKIFGTIGALGPAIGVIAASYSGCDKLMVTAFFTIGMGLMGAFIPSMELVALDLSPNYAGILTALAGTLGVSSGVLAPCIVGLLTPDRTLQEWRFAFWISCGILVTTNFLFVIFGSAEVQPWNDPLANLNTEIADNARQPSH